LWALVLPAVQATREAARRYLAEEGKGRHVSGVHVPEFKVNAAGWPSTTSSLGLRAEGPPDLPTLFGRDKSTYNPIPFSEVPPLERLVDAVTADPSLRSRICQMAEFTQKDDGKNFYYDYEASEVPLRIMARCEALGLESDDEVEQIYRELEMGLFAEVLVADIVVPLVLTKLELNSTLRVAPGVVLEPLSAEMQQARAPEWYGGSRGSPYVVAAATHAVVVENVSILNPGETERRIRMQTAELDLSAVEAVCEALAIVTGRETGYASVYVRPIGWADRWTYNLPAINHVKDLHRYPDQFDDGKWNKAGLEVSAADVAQLAVLTPRIMDGKPNLRLATRRYFQSFLRADDDDVTLDACIGIEALLGAGRDELTHRMALRAATVLSTAEPRWPASMAAKVLREVYAHRSAIVHGTQSKRQRMKVGDQDALTSSWAVYLLRRLLMSNLTSESPWTAEQLDDRLLLVLDAQTPPAGEGG
jgi:hypothetical protein